MPRYAPVPSRARFAESELEILELWRSNRVFERTLALREGAPPFVFGTTATAHRVAALGFSSSASVGVHFE